MKKIIIITAVIISNVCYSQTITGVKVYVSNPYVQRVDVIKTQMYNMDYVRSHYATYVYSMEENYINNMFDSLFSQPLKRVCYDSIGIIIPSDWRCGTLDMNFEPCIVIDFVINNKYNINEEVWTFSVNRQGYVCRTFHSEGSVLCYPDKKSLDYLKRTFPGIFFLHK